MQEMIELRLEFINDLGRAWVITGDMALVLTAKMQRRVRPTTQIGKYRRTYHLSDVIRFYKGRARLRHVKMCGARWIECHR